MTNQKAREGQRRRYLANVEKERERHRRWEAANPEKKKKLRLAHPEKMREYRLKWQKNNPDKSVIIMHRHRARIRGNGGTFTVDEINNLMIEQQYLCHYCRNPIAFNYHIDHKVPVSRGGDGSIDNIALTCPDCNFHKSDKTDIEFLEAPL